MVEGRIRSVAALPQCPDRGRVEGGDGGEGGRGEPARGKATGFSSCAPQTPRSASAMIGQTMLLLLLLLREHGVGVVVVGETARTFIRSARPTIQPDEAHHRQRWHVLLEQLQSHGWRNGNVPKQEVRRAANVRRQEEDRRNSRICLRLRSVSPTALH